MKITKPCIALSLALALCAPAVAQTPQQIQGMIANGQETQALSDLNTVLQSHPNSGVAWYLTAEAKDAQGDESGARAALANAEQDAPGLPFAQPDKVAALENHLNPSGTGTTGHASPALLIIGGLVLLFLFSRLFARRRVYGVPQGYGAGYPGQPMGYGGGFGGGGLGSSLLGGLAAGAGFAAGERIIDDLSGNQNVAPPDDPQAWDNGLNGAPNWDDGSNNNFDQGNNW